MSDTAQKISRDYITQTDIEFISHVKDRFRVHIESLGTRDAMIPLLYSIYRDSVMLLHALTDVQITIELEEPSDSGDEIEGKIVNYKEEYLGDWYEPQ